MLWIRIQYFFKFPSRWILCDFANLDFRPKRHLKMLLTCIRHMLLIFKSDKQSGILSLSLFLWKYIYIVLSAFRYNLFIEHHSKYFLISLLAISKQVFYVTMWPEKFISSFAPCCRSFTKIRKRRVPSIEPWGTLHLMIS